MRKKLLQFVVAGILVTLPPLGMTGQHAPVHAAGASHTHSPSTDETRVVATIHALFDVAKRVDLAALDSLYAGDSLTVIERAGLDRTWKDYRDHRLVPELKEFENFWYRPSEIDPHVDGDAAWAIFRYTRMHLDNGARARRVAAPRKASTTGSQGREWQDAA